VISGRIIFRSGLVEEYAMDCPVVDELIGVA